MKLMISLIFCSAFLLITASSMHALQTINVRGGTRTGDPFEAQLNITGGAFASLEISDQAKAAIDDIILEGACVLYGLKLIAHGIEKKADADDKTKKASLESSKSSLEAGSHKRKASVNSSSQSATEALLDEDEEEDKPRKSRCSWLSSCCASRGMQQIRYGTCLTLIGTAHRLLRSFGNKL